MNSNIIQVLKNFIKEEWQFNFELDNQESNSMW